VNTPSTNQPSPFDLEADGETVDDGVAAALAGFAPQIRPPRLPATDVAYVVEDTPIGRMLLARHQAGALVASSFVPTSTEEDLVLTRISRLVSPRVLRHPAELDEARGQLEAFLSGASHGFTLRTDLALATPFQRVVLPRLAATVSYGARTTYGELASAIARPSAARAVGAALGANPLCVVLPCHRVVAASGALTGYAGGIEAKRYLLELEAGVAS
jgi:methylated-DNA-[protein]-cysteine S-methyltransferase